MSPHSNLAYIQQSIRCNSATPAQKSAGSCLTFGSKPNCKGTCRPRSMPLRAPQPNPPVLQERLGHQPAPHVLSTLLERGRSGLTTAGQLSAHSLSRVPDLSHCLRQALLGHAKLVGPVLNLMGFQKADARPVCRSSVVRIICHAWLPFRRQLRHPRVRSVFVAFPLHRNSPLVASMD